MAHSGHIGRTVSLKREGHDRIMISGGWHGLWDSEVNRGHTIDAAIEGNVTEAIAIYPLLKDLRIEVSDANHLETSPRTKYRSLTDYVPLITSGMQPGGAVTDGLLLR